MTFQKRLTSKQAEKERLPSRWALNTQTVKRAYRRWAGVYDMGFGGISHFARLKTVQSVNGLPGSEVLEVGVGTGLALSHYAESKFVTGIDLSTDMLAYARKRLQTYGYKNVRNLLEMNAEHTSFEDSSFDIAVAMFVASVVPHPRQLLQELKRIVKPGGYILFVNHFLAEKGIRRDIEYAMARASHLLGWHPDFAIETLLPSEDIARAYIQPMFPMGLFTLVTLENYSR